MIVCLCEGVSESEVQRQIQRGCRTVADLGSACGAGTSCGSCSSHLREMLSRGAEGERGAVAPTATLVPAAPVV